VQGGALPRAVLCARSVHKTASRKRCVILVSIPNRTKLPANPRPRKKVGEAMVGKISEAIRPIPPFHLGSPQPLQLDS
jgi:hypothetical protein